MPSPFPGMDPYLEEPTLWGGLHTRLITTISDLLADIVSPHFLVDIETRVHIVTPDDPEGRRLIAPDIYIMTGRNPREPAAMVGSVTTPTLIEPLYDLEIRERYIEIRDARNREVVTTIEILSPFNKAAGTEGREAFLRKRGTVMGSKVHWIEIDLLRAGERAEELEGKSDYYALLKRGGQPPPFEGWLFDVRDRMPTIAVPLRPPFEDVPLNLQAVFETVYARGHYAEAIDYAGPPSPPRLRPADANWAHERVQAWLAARDQTATGGE